MRSRPVAILVVLLMIGWPLTIVGSAGAVPASNSALSDSTIEADFIEEDDGQFTNASDDLIVWERSFKPLRADTTADSAETVIANHNLFFKDNRSVSQDETSANRPETAIFNKDGTIPIELKNNVTNAKTTKFNNRSAQVIIASFDKNEDTTDVASADQLSEVVSPALDGNLSELRTEAADRNVTFTVNDTQLENGQLTYNLTADTAGPYVVMVALPRDDNNTGFSTNDKGLLTLPGTATLVGVEGVMVQDSASEISPQKSVLRGNNITLDPNTELGGNDTTHSVVVYDEETFRDQTTKLRLDKDISSSLTSEDIVLEHTIKNVNGVGEMSDSGTIFGTSVSQRTITGTVALADIVDQLSNETNVSINRETISPETTLDASGVVKPNAGTPPELTVQTYGNWSEGTYRIVHVAENGTVEGVATSTDTIKIKKRTTSGGGGSDGGDGGDDDDDDDYDNDVSPPDVPKPEVTITERDRGVSVSVTNIPANTPTRVGAGRTVTSGGATVNNFSVNTSRDLDELNLEVDASEAPPDTVPEPANVDTLAYIDVDAGNLTDDDYNSVEWEFTVDQERLDELVSSPENVQLNRFNETSGEWESFGTTHQGENEFTATVPGFSTFAITAAAINDGDTDDGTDSTDDGTDSTDDGTDSTDGDGDDGTDGTDGDGGERPVGLIILLVVLVIVAAVGVGLYRNQQ